jgi:hypothetical protein
MSNLGNLVDRTYREYLEPLDDLNSYTTLSTGISDSDTEVAFDGNLLSVEEEDALDAGTVIEIGRELMFATALNAVANTITVVRGARGTTATSHLSGELIKIAPVFPRQNVFNAVVDQIETLYPTLFAVETLSFTNKEGYQIIGSYDTPGTYNYLVAPIKAISQYTQWDGNADSTSVQWRGVSVELVDLPNPFTYKDENGTERTITYTAGPNVVHALQTYGISSGFTVNVTFKKKFLDKDSYTYTGDIENTTVASIGLQTEYEPIIMAGVAAQMLAGRDIPSATADYITDQMSVQNYPVNSSSNIRNSLLQYQQQLIQQARKDLRARYPEPVTINSIAYPSS